MNRWLLFGILIACGYLIGAIPFSYLIGRLFGVDIRKTGSGNVGATNVTRSAGKLAGFLAYVSDIGKGLGVVIGAAAILSAVYPDFPRWMLLFIGIAAMLGHIFPVYLGFKGGKGVATATGVMFVLAPASVLSSLVIFFIGFFASGKTISIGSTCAAIAFPLFLTVYRFFLPNVYNYFFAIGYPWLMGCACAVTITVLLLHIPNYKRLIEGKELKFEKK